MKGLGLGLAELVSLTSKSGRLAVTPMRVVGLEMPRLVAEETAGRFLSTDGQAHHSQDQMVESEEFAWWAAGISLSCVESLEQQEDVLVLDWPTLWQVHMISEGGSGRQYHGAHGCRRCRCSMGFGIEDSRCS